MVNNQNGFSLIELMIVVAIINILASIAVPNYLTYKNKASFYACKTSLHSLEMAELMHYLENDTFTNNGDDLAAWMRTPTPNAAGLNELISGNCTEWTASANISFTADSYTITATPKGKYDCTITMQEDGLVTPKNYSECRKQSGN